MRDNIYIPKRYEALWRDLKAQGLVPGLLLDLLKKQTRNVPMRPLRQSDIDNMAKDLAKALAASKKDR